MASIRLKQKKNPWCTSRGCGVQNSGPWDPWLPVVENSRLFAQRKVRALSTAGTINYRRSTSHVLHSVFLLLCILCLHRTPPRNHVTRTTLPIGTDGSRAAKSVVPLHYTTFVKAKGFLGNYSPTTPRPRPCKPLSTTSNAKKGAWCQTGGGGRVVWVACRAQAEAGMLGRWCGTRTAARFAKDMLLPSLSLPPQCAQY